MTADKNKAKAASEYTAKQITVLEGLEPVRKRLGMYIGNISSTGNGKLECHTVLFP